VRPGSSDLSFFFEKRPASAANPLANNLRGNLPDGEETVMVSTIALSVKSSRPCSCPIGDEKAQTLANRCRPQRAHGYHINPPFCLGGPILRRFPSPAVARPIETILSTHLPAPPACRFLAAPLTASRHRCNRRMVWRDECHRQFVGENAVRPLARQLLMPSPGPLQGQAYRRVDPDEEPGAVPQDGGEKWAPATARDTSPLHATLRGRLLRIHGRFAHTCAPETTRDVPRRSGYGCDLAAEYCLGARWRL